MSCTSHSASTIRTAAAAGAFHRDVVRAIFALPVVPGARESYGVALVERLRPFLERGAVHEEVLPQPARQ